MWIGLLALILGIWFPLNFAAELGTTLPSLDMRGPPAIVELTAHGGVAALCAAAGWSLWLRRPHGPLLARAALVAAAAVAVQSHYWSTLPSQTVPGDELPLSALAVLHSAVWLLFLARSSRVREIS